MIDLEREVCVCNSVTALEIRDFNKEENINSLQELLDQDELPLNNKCESCAEDGYENDGFSLAMVYAMTKDGRI